ncbi:MAG: radical SAM/SPASM domain-containing protein [Nitrospirales bacterium]|nr:radical SAM/SPASM domain-containing protein [Nitrospirales bacterium]
MFCNIGLTNKCNLRCEICGSQKFLDETGTPRRHMELSTFYSVAETLFPFLVQVELNSQGDPLLHPNIEKVLETIAAYGCQIKVQTNGTLFTDRIIDLLVQQRGIVMLSLDAVGPHFDEVRSGGNWAKAEPQIIKFLRARNPRRLSVGVYPTITRRTLPEVLNILDWCQDVSIDEIAFHQYSPIQNSFEEQPSGGELKTVRENIEGWIAKSRPSMKVAFEGVILHQYAPPRRKFAFSGLKGLTRWLWYHFLQAPWAGPHRGWPVMFPVDPDHGRAISEIVCAAPTYYVEIGLEGQVHACCRAQDVTLGYATSPSEFADVWLGPNYAKIRNSLRRKATGPFPLPNCDSCIKFHVQKYNPERKALKYDGNDNQHPEALQLGDENLIRIDVCSKEVGFCNMARLPYGIDPSAFELWEGETRLGPGFSSHDDIRFIGQGRYSIWGRELYFSTSDKSDAKTNGRVYRLRKIKKELLLVPSSYDKGTVE